MYQAFPDVELFTCGLCLREQIKTSRIEPRTSTDTRADIIMEEFKTRTKQN